MKLTKDGITVKRLPRGITPVPAPDPAPLPESKEEPKQAPKKKAPKKKKAATPQETKEK